MRIKAWLKVPFIAVALLAAGSIALFYSDWFQKKYLYPLPYEGLIYRNAMQQDVSPYLVAGVILAESKFIHQARSPKGATGLMQVMPETAQWIAEQMNDGEYSSEDLNDPQINIRLGTWYLASLKKEFSANEVLMLAAYNGGRGNVKQWMNKYGWDMEFADTKQIPFQETRDYVGKVLKYKKRYQELYGR